MLSNINIQSPYFIGLLLAAPILWYLAKQFSTFRKKNLRLFGSEDRLEEQLKSGGIVTKRFWMFLIGLGLLALAATNPRMKGQPTNITKKGGDVIFALDVSKSMLAQDIKPSRLDRARLVCLNLLQDFDNQRVAVVVFAGDAYVTMPFSTNYSAVASFIDEASPNQISAQGSDYANLIETLVEFFGKDKLVERGVVVLSDGEDHSHLSKSDVRQANEGGLIFYTVGIGTTKGAPIPTRRGYLQDQDGKKVISKLHKKSLQTLAGKQGKYFVVSEQHELLSAIRHLRQSNFSDIKSYEYESLFQYFLLPGILLILFSFFVARPRSNQTPNSLKASTIVLLLFFVFAQAQAQETHQQFLKADQSFKKEKFDEASLKYNEVLQTDEDNVQALYNLGVTDAKSSNKKDALKHFAKAAELSDNQEDRASSLYNAGTLLLTEKDQLDQSIELLKEALRNRPKDEDIRKNLAKAIQIKRQQQRQKQEQQKKDKNQKQNNQDQKDQQNQDQQKQNQENKDDKGQEKEQEKQKEEQGKKEQENKQTPSGNKDNQEQQSSQQKPIDIKKQKALQKLKSVDEAERRVRQKIQKLKSDKSSSRNGKNW